MPRRARLSVPGIPWHIIQRGINRSACFFSDEDYQYYLTTLAEQAEEHHCSIHAYVLMTNHVHLLITPENANSAALLMKNLGQRYVQYVNRYYRRSGTLWEGRFKSCLAQDDTYLLTCQRYIELNPVRARMVQKPDEYPWSSYLANTVGQLNSILTPHAQYLLLGRSKIERLEAYRSLFKAHMDEDEITQIRHATNGNYVLGDDRFQQQIEQMLNCRVVPGKSGRPRKAEA